MKINLCGKRIKMARINKEMHQVDLAAALSVDYNIEMSQSMISAVERGTRAITDIELVAFAKVLEVKTSWLLFGEAGEK